MAENSVDRYSTVAEPVRHLRRKLNLFADLRLSFRTHVRIGYVRRRARAVGALRNKVNV